MMHLSAGYVLINLINPIPAISESWIVKDQDDLERHTIHAFARTIVPGDFEEDLVLSLMKDPFYGFNRYLSVFIRDLNVRAKLQYGINRFYKLNPHQRETIIENVLEQPSILAKLYLGAILLTQIAVYASDKRSIPHQLIDFPGEDIPSEFSYENPYEFLTGSITENGHPH